MPIEIKVPELGESITEATILRWLKQTGESVAIGDVLIELETEKVNLEVGAEKAGVLTEQRAAAGQDVKVGEVIGVIDESAGDGDGGAKQAKEKSETAPPETIEAAAEKEESRRGDGKETPPAAPSAPETPPISREPAEPEAPEEEDRKKEAKQKPSAQEPRKEAPPSKERKPAEPAPAAGPRQESGRSERKQERVRLSRRRRTIAERLVEAQRTAAILTTFNEIDMRTVMEARRRNRESFEERHGVKLGLTSFFVKAAVGALRDFPDLNSELDGDEVIRKHYYDIGIAVDSSEGLVVPVLRDADRMSFAEIERAVRDFAVKAREGSLTLDDLRGGTFTITNGGVFGSLLSTPILNPPQVGILGLHRIQDRPVAIEGEVRIRPMMYAALSYDHRLIDGRTAVRFLVRLKELVEDPQRMLLEG